MRCLVTLIPILLFSMHVEASFRGRAHLELDEFSTEDVITELQVGRALAARILSDFNLTENEQAQKYVNSLGSFVVSKIGRPEIKYYFAIIETDEINAYAIPGGYIFLTKGALKKAGSEAVLLGILAHEIGHINERHAVRALKIRSSGILFQMSGALGGMQTYLGFLESTVGKGMELLFEKGLEQKDEFSADSYAVTFLSSQGIDPKPFTEFLKKINADPQMPISVLRKTHPPLKARIRMLEDFQNKMGKVDNVRSIREERYQNILTLL
jgi:beta-barrel assembly-enhancing protease